jgi:hypothetical protein
MFLKVELMNDSKNLVNPPWRFCIHDDINKKFLKHHLSILSMQVVIYIMHFNFNFNFVSYEPCLSIFLKKNFIVKYLIVISCQVDCLPLNLCFVFYMMLSHGWGGWSIIKRSAYKCFHTIWKQSQFYVQWMQRHHTLHHVFLCICCHQDNAKCGYWMDCEQTIDGGWSWLKYGKFYYGWKCNVL